MITIQNHEDFYIYISKDNIQVCTRLSCSSYPVWLGKNRAVMRDVIKHLEKNPPDTLVDFLDIVGKFNLHGIGSNEKPNKDFFKKDDNTIDNNKIFW